MNFPVVSAAWLPPIRAWVYRSNSVRAAVTACRWASLTRSSPPTNAVKETDFAAENVASQPALCSTGLMVAPAALTHQLLASDRVLAFAQPGKVLRVNRSGKAESFGQLTLPLADDGAVLL